MKKESLKEALLQWELEIVGMMETKTKIATVKTKTVQTQRIKETPVKTRIVDAPHVHNYSIMKWSYYNSLHKNDNQSSFFFNCRTRKLLLLDIHLVTLLQGELSDINHLAWRHPDFFAVLVENGFIVEDSCDEFDLFCKSLLDSEKNSHSFEIIINPTLDCNLSCWYCYEKHLKGSRINADILISIQNLIESKLADNKIDQLSLSFFGGEPLLEFENVVWEIILYTVKHNKLKKNIHLSFTTNATLLTKSVVDKLVSTGYSISLQIPFDGGRDIHNKIKYSGSIMSPFDSSLDNLVYAASKGIKVSVRCNYDDRTISSFEELIDGLTESDIDKNIRFSFQKIWQVKKNDETEKEKNRLIKKVDDCSKNFSVSDDITIRPCYGDAYNSVVVNYNGDIFKCTARDFSRDNREGILSENGEIIFNERFLERMNRRFSNEHCHNCHIFPICNLCSQQRLEHHNDGCIRGINESQKNEYLLSIIRNLVQ